MIPPIPITAAKKVAEQYGYDQIIIIGRKVDQPGNPGSESVTTYGINKEHCDAAAKAGNYLKHHVMQWPYDEEERQVLMAGAEAIRHMVESDHPGNSLYPDWKQCLKIFERLFPI